MDRCDDLVRRTPGSLVDRTADGRQAFDRRGRGQDLAPARSARLQLWEPPTRCCRAGVSDIPAGRSTSSKRYPGYRVDLDADEMKKDPRRGRLRHLRGRSRSGAGGSQALRAPRRHRHRRVHPADRLIDHVEEDRRGDRGTGPRREGRLGRVPSRHRVGAFELAETMVGLGAAHGVKTTALLTDMDEPLGLNVGQRARGDRIGRGPPWEGTRGCGRDHASRWPTR